LVFDTKCKNKKLWRLIEMKINNDTNKWNITKEFIIQKYIQNGKSLPQIAKEIGMPYETLFWYKKKF